MSQHGRRTSSRLRLPANYNRDIFLSYHQWDKIPLAEHTTANNLTKGIVIVGRPSRIVVRLGMKSANAILDVDGGDGNGETAKRIGRNMMGLNQPIEKFEGIYCDHPEIGPLIRSQSGVRIPQVSPFEALSRAIMGQQVSVVSAIAIRHRLIKVTAVRHSSGIFCFPDPGTVLKTGKANLLRAGFSNAKADTLLAVSERIDSGDIPLDLWWNQLHAGEKSDTEIGEELCALRGIGPWTVNYTLTRGFDWLDGSLHGDVGMRRGLEKLLGIREKITDSFAESWLRQFVPWRGLVTAHLWAYRSAGAP